MIALVCACWLAPVAADQYRPAYLEFTQTGADSFDILWKVPGDGKGRRLPLDVLLPPEVTPVSQPRRTEVGLATIERWSIRHDGALAGVVVKIQGLERLSTDVLVRIERLDGTTETARLHAASTEWVVDATPQFMQVVNTYLRFGVEHILAGLDHLLFVACLIFIAGSGRRILITVTGFTLAHSLTLTLAALGLLRLPVPPVEAVIALSIVFLAREIALDRRDTLTWRYPIAVSATFGLLHGLGFASALSEIGLPRGEIPAALIAFNVGVEIGQLLFVGVLMLAWLLAGKLMKLGEIDRDGWMQSMQKPVAYAIGSVTMLWTLERVAAFWI